MDGETFRRLVERRVCRLAGRPLEDVNARVLEHLCPGDVRHGGKVDDDTARTAATSVAEEICRDHGIAGEGLSYALLSLHVDDLFGVFDMWSRMSDRERTWARNYVSGLQIPDDEDERSFVDRFVFRLMGLDFIETLAILREGAHIDITKEGRTT